MHVGILHFCISKLYLKMTMLALNNFLHNLFVQEKEYVSNLNFLFYFTTRDFSSLSTHSILVILQSISIKYKFHMCEKWQSACVKEI